MVWGYTRHHADENIWFLPNTTAILGFNEPNMYNQANLTARQAAEHWPEIERKSHGAPLVSPSAIQCGGPEWCYGNQFEWFDEFFRLCNGCRVDYLATHKYTCDANYLMSYLQSLYGRYHKKIWLTEFACPDTTDPNVQLKYMKEILPRLEAAPFVYR